MMTDVKRILHLDENPWDDEPLESDLTLLRSGLLVLSWTNVDGVRKWPFVTPDSTALRYLKKSGRLTPANRRTLRELADIRRTDTNWIAAHLKATTQYD